MEFNANGDLVTEKGQVFRQIGWIIRGGKNDGLITTNANLREILREPHGGYSPVYVEVGTD